MLVLQNILYFGFPQDDALALKLVGTLYVTCDL